MFKQRYVLNPDTFTFERARIQRRDVLKAVGQITVLSLLLTFLFVNAIHLWHGNLEELTLKAKQNDLIAQLANQSRQFAQLETDLDRLHEKDNNFYRSILDLPKHDPAVWQAGVGGDVAQHQGLQSDVSKLITALDRRHEALQHKLAVQAESFEQLHTVALQKTEELKHIPAIRPVKGARLISHYGYRRDPFHGGRAFHAGSDFACRIGTPIRAVGDGVVVIAGRPQSGYGIQVEIDHGFGYRTKYAHLSKLEVKVGDRVKRGQLIAQSGNTGRSTGPHLHYEVIKNGKKRNPIEYFYGN